MHVLVAIVRVSIVARLLWTCIVEIDIVLLLLEPIQRKFVQRHIQEQLEAFGYLLRSLVCQLWIAVHPPMPYNLHCEVVRHRNETVLISKLEPVVD